MIFVIFSLEEKEGSDAEPVIIAFSVGIPILAIPILLAIRAWCMRKAEKGMRGKNGNKHNTQHGNSTNDNNKNEEEALTTSGTKDNAEPDAITSKV